jgi:hypothetical protein
MGINRLVPSLCSALAKGCLRLANGSSRATRWRPPRSAWVARRTTPCTPRNVPGCTGDQPPALSPKCLRGDVGFRGEVGVSASDVAPHVGETDAYTTRPELSW